MIDIWHQPEIAQVVQALQPLEVYLVGGAVRDLLLGRPIKDYDFLIDCEPDHLLSLKPTLKQATGRTVVVLDAQRGILRVCQRDAEGLDLCARQGETVQEDLARRDITFNAMALSAHGELLDPFGGEGDLAARQVRVTSPQVLQDDPLRVLRAFRLAATLGFDLDSETVEQLRHAAPGLQRIAGERIREEMLRFLASIDRRLTTHLRQSEVTLALFRIGEFPWGPLVQDWCDQRPAGEPLPRSTHTTLSVLAAILWFEAAVGPERADQLTNRIKLSRQQVRFLQSWWDGARLLHYYHPQAWTTRAVHALHKTAADSLPHLLEFAVLDTFAPGIPIALADRILNAPQGELRPEPLPLSGRDLCQHHSRPPGPWLGPLIKELETAWACREYNDIPTLLQHSATFL